MFNTIQDPYDNYVFDPGTIKTGTLPGGPGEIKPAASVSARSALGAAYPVDVRMVRGQQGKGITAMPAEKLEPKVFVPESED
jgi:hypothetical protein